MQNEIDNQEVAKALGCKKAFPFYYRNRMDDCAMIKIRQRLIFVFRLLQVNTVFVMDPYDHYDENPDHIVVGNVVESASWMASPGPAGTRRGQPEARRLFPSSGPRCRSRRRWESICQS